MVTFKAHVKIPRFPGSFIRLPVTRLQWYLAHKTTSSPMTRRQAHVSGPDSPGGVTCSFRQSSAIPQVAVGSNLTLKRSQEGPRALR